MLGRPHAGEFPRGRAQAPCVFPTGLTPKHGQLLLRRYLNLTVAEANVAYLLPSGLTVKEMASRTERSVSTIKHHLEHILGKTLTANGRELAALVTAVLWWATVRDGAVAVENSPCPIDPGRSADVEGRSL